jgi:hypothetical protein
MHVLTNRISLTWMWPFTFLRFYDMSFRFVWLFNLTGLIRTFTYPYMGWRHIWIAVYYVLWYNNIVLCVMWDIVICHPRVVHAVFTATKSTQHQYQSSKFCISMLDRSNGPTSNVWLPCVKCPDPLLQAVVLVNSGFEASHLALRLARASTKSKNTIIVVDGAYHVQTLTVVVVFCITLQVSTFQRITQPQGDGGLLLLFLASRTTCYFIVVRLKGVTNRLLQRLVCLFYFG